MLMRKYLSVVRIAQDFLDLGLCRLQSDMEETAYSVLCQEHLRMGLPVIMIIDEERRRRRH